MHKKRCSQLEPEEYRGKMPTPVRVLLSAEAERTLRELRVAQRVYRIDRRQLTGFAIA